MFDPHARGLDGLPITRRSTTRRRRWWLLVLACAETASLGVLLLNLGLIGHDPAVARAIGPIHGCLYVTGLVLTWSGPFRRPVKSLAVLPIVGVWTATVMALRQTRP